MKKVVFLRVARGSPGYESGPHATALVLQKTADGYLTIQGHAPVAWSERHQCWQLFRRAAKSLLGVCESLPVSVALSEPPHATVSDLGDVFRQPSHIVSLTLSPLPHESELEREADRRKNERQAAASPSGRTCGNYGPTPAASGLYQPPRASPLSSPQAKRRAKTLGEGRREMERLLVQLDEVSQTLERTQSRCEDIARRCDSGSRRARSAGEEGFEETDCASDDQRVERLLRVAESLTAKIIIQQRRSPTPTIAAGVGSPRQPGGTMSSERGGVPEAPTDVSAQPSLNGGAFVFWRPVRLDDRDRNNGCKVAGYGVYVDGVQRTKVNEPFGSHVEMDGLENGAQYQIQVSTLASDDRESPLSPAIQYRHEARSPSSLHPPSTATHPTNSQSSKVENWLLTNSQSTTRLSPSHTRTPERSDETTHPDRTHLPEDTWSMGSSHTSGIVMDHPPGSPKLTPSCPSFYHGDGFSVHSGATTLIVDGQTALSPYHHHQLRFSPSPSSTPSRTPSLTPKPGGDGEIDEPLDFASITAAEETQTEKAAAMVQLVAGSRHRGPAPPSGVQVTQRQPGWLHVSWTPTKRDGKGCSNGCFVLGYRLYINGTPRVSVDGPMTYETSLRWPLLDSAHKLSVHVRTRSIAAESLPSSTVLYDMILQESVQKYLGAKVTSPLSSTTTLCPSNSAQPRPLHKRAQRSDARETYV